MPLIVVNRVTESDTASSKPVVRQALLNTDDIHDATLCDENPPRTRVYFRVVEGLHQPAWTVLGSPGDIIFAHERAVRP